MALKKMHYISGLIMAAFVGLHLLNHAFSIYGADKHIAVMAVLRHFYRNIFVETILLLTVTAQMYSGLKLFSSKRPTATTMFEKLAIWTGLYLSLFFVIHVGAVLAGRLVLNLDTNFYFGVAGLNSFPFNLFFIPYYWLAVVSFCGHIASVHYQRMTRNVLGINPYRQSILILSMGICFAVFLIYGLTNRFKGFDIPAAYNVLIGQ